MNDPISQQNAVKELLAWGDWTQHQRDRQDEYDDFVRTLTPEQLKLYLKIRQQDLADAQKHGEQIGWKRGMSEAAIMMEKGLQTENSGVKYWGNISELKTHEAILAARDSKNKL